MDKLLETVVRGSKSFPFERYYLYGKNDKDLITKLHWHDDIEIIFVLSGGISLRIENLSFNLLMGDICFISPKELHSIYAASDNYSYIAYVFSPGIMEFKEDIFFNTEVLTPLKDGRKKLPKAVTKKHPLYEKIANQMSDLSSYYDMGQNYKAMILSALIYIFSEIYCGGFLTEENGNRKAENASKRIKKCTAYLKEHYSEKITLKQLADLCYMSPNYFCSYFKSYTGTTPFCELNSIRVEAAANLLKNEDASVLNAALLCGFESVGYFIKTFKKMMGVTPSVYKRREKNRL